MYDGEMRAIERRESSRAKGAKGFTNCRIGTPKVHRTQPASYVNLRSSSCLKSKNIRFAVVAPVSELGIPKVIVAVCACLAGATLEDCLVFCQNGDRASG
ncbi:hypothetical protein HanLR1_Chr17g0679631 [Helianthus annuus]|nr:hypothetical protein HanLR1_Chr17g0679631 [Helianthus annuus]